MCLEMEYGEKLSFRKIKLSDTKEQKSNIINVQSAIVIKQLSNWF